MNFKGIKLMTIDLPQIESDPSVDGFTSVSLPPPSHPARPVPVTRRVFFSCAVLLLCMSLCLSLAAVGWVALIVLV